jgi:hypothetical protein
VLSGAGEVASEAEDEIWKYLAKPLADTAAAAVAGVGHTDEVLNQMLLDYGVDPQVAFAISNPYDAFKLHSAMGGLPAGQPPQRGAGNDAGSEPQVPFQFGDLAEAFGAQLRPPVAAPSIRFDAPPEPNYAEAQKILRAITPGDRPVAPSDRELLAATLAGAAGGAASGTTVGQTLALAAAGGYNAQDSKVSEFHKRLDEFDRHYSQLELQRGQALGAIEAAQADFRLKVKDAALRADIANANQQIALMQLSQPKSDIVGGYLVVNQWDPLTGKLSVQRYQVNPLIEQITLMAATAKGRDGKSTDVLTYPLAGGGSFAIKDPGMQAHLLRSINELTANPNSELSKRAIAIAAQAAFPSSDDPESEAEAMRLRDPEKFNQLVLAPAAMILLVDGINTGREIQMPETK